MSRPLWRGNITFGLVNIPVNLYSAERKSEGFHFHLLDKKNHARIQNQRVNQMTGKPVAWTDIEKAYEFEKGKYVTVDQKMLEKTAANNYETVEISDFIPTADVEPIYFNKPYFLIPSETGTKGYLLLHEILKKTKKMGIATVVIKTREYIAGIIPINNLLAMVTLRYARDLRSIKDFELINPAASKKIKITQKEMELAEQLVKSMSTKWNPKQYHDKNRELMYKLIQENIKKGKSVTDRSRTETKESEGSKHKVKSDKVVDFMSLLKKSLDTKGKKRKIAANDPDKGNMSKGKDRDISLDKNRHTPHDKHKLNKRHRKHA